MKKFLLVTALLLSSFAILHAEDVLYSWDFGTSGDPEGWRPTHDLTPFIVNGGVLITKSTGTDPYMHGPTVNFEAHAYPYIKIRMKVSAGSTAEFFWQLKGMQWEAPGYEQPFELIADNNFHVYLVYLGENEKWKDTVTRLRLDPTTVAGASIEIDYIRVLSLGPRLQIKTFGPDVLLPKTGEQFNIACVVENTGDKEVQAIRAQLFSSQGLQLQESDSIQTIPTLTPGESHTFNWPVIAQQSGEFHARVQVKADNIPYPLESQVAIAVESTAVVFPPEIPDAVQAYPFDSHYWILENSNIRFIFDRLQNFRLFAARDGEWVLLGASRPISRLEFLLDDQRHKVELIPDSLQVIYATSDSTTLQLTGQYTDDDNGVWSFAFQFALSRQASHIDARYQLLCSRSRSLLLFTGPSIYLGEGSFEENLDEAILPGLEWLVSGERSSSTLDAYPPYNLRFAPHPLKITAPIMAINYDGITAGLFWDPYQKWDGTYSHPAIEFAAPNWLEGQKNHKLSLMLPSIPNFISENHSRATDPYPLQAGKTVSVQGQFYALKGLSALDAFDYYFRIHGQPALQPPARPLDEEVELCRDGFETVWSESAKGWQHAVGWDYSPYPGFAFLQYLDAAMTTDPAVKTNLKNRVNAVVKKIIRNSGERGLTSRAGTHIAGWQLPFYVGHLGGAINGIKSQANGILNAQHDNGGWPFAGDPTLGTAGQYELGTCAQKTFLLLYAYQLTGDSRYWQGAQKALHFLQTFKVPRGAQTWEVPLHTPDILAAAHAIRAFATAYRISENETYLDQARYWARAGLPFIYFWSEPEIETMPFATIPVLGATHYTYPWFGKPVQWCGLVYSHALFELASVDPQPDFWQRLARGITRSAMFMQRTEGEYKGTYPDAWNLFINAPQPVYINPEDIIKNVLFTMGSTPELDNVIIAAGGKRLHLTSGGRIQNAVYDSTSLSLDFQCDFFRAETCYVLIAGLVKTPAKVLVNNAELTSVANVDVVPQGWRYTNSGYLVLKFVQPDDSPVAIKITNVKTQVNESKESGSTVPTSFYLGQNYPNPFSLGRDGSARVTTIEFQLPQREQVKMQIFDLRGRLVTTLMQAAKEAGAHQLVWDGLDDQRRLVPSGLYLCRLEAGGRSFLRKIVVVR